MTNKQVRDCAAFHLWVANTVAELGGSKDQYLRGVEAEWALTLGANRMVECQVPAQRFYTCKKQALARFAGEAVTNNTVIH